MNTQSKLFTKAIVLIAVFAAGLIAPWTGHAASGTWTSTTSGGLWSATGNWSGGIVADASGSTADFSTINITTDPTVVHLDSVRTISNLTFGDTTTSSAAGWLLDNNAVAGNILTLAGTTPTITVNTLGTGKIATISGVIAGTVGLTKSGAGTLSLTGANTFTGGLIVSAGELDSSASVSGPGTVTVGNSVGTAILGVTGGTIALGSSTFFIGSGPNNTYIGVVNQSGGTVSFTGGTAMLLGNGTNTVATYNLSGGTLTTGTFASGSRGVMLGVNNGCNGTFNLSGTGTLSLGLAELAVGRDEGSVTNNTVAFNQSGGTATVGNLSIGGGLIGTVGTVAAFNLTNGTFAATNFQHLTASASSSANIYLGGGAQVTLPAFPTPVGTVNLTLDFTNGYLSPLAANLNYLSGLANVYLTTNGANFNVGVSNITISQILQNSPSQAGTLRKTGVGTLTLPSVNTYSGATTISAGELMGVVGGSLASSAVAVTPTSGVGILGVSYTGGNAQWTCSSLSFNAGGTGTALEFAFNTAPSTTTAPLSVVGNLTFGVTPSVTVDVPNVTAGTYPLIVVGGTAPSAVPALNWSPSARQGTLGGSLAWGGTGNKTLILTVTGSSVEPLNWSTSTVGTWDVNNSANTAWKNSAAVPATAYYQETGNQYQNDQVVFSDTYITANTTVTNLGTLTPASVTFNNSTYNYTNVGSGAIAGLTTLTKTGTGAVTIFTTNTYIGGTTISQGTVNATVAGALGGGVVTNNGTLNLTAGGVAYTGLSAGMSGSGTVNVTLGTGSGTTFLNGNNAGFTGTLNVGTNGMTNGVSAIGAGKLQLNGALANTATVNIISNSTVYISSSVTNGAALYLYGGDTGESFGQLRIEGGAWSGPVTLAGPITGSSDGHIGAASGTGTIAGNIGQSGGAQSLVKVGAGTIVLAGTNTYTGFTTNVTGILKFGSAGVLGDGGVNSSAGLVLTGGTVDFAGFSPTAIVPLLLNSTANGNDVGSIESSTAGVVTYGGPVAIGATTLVFGTGNFLFTNTVTGNSKNVNKNGTGTAELINSGNVTLGGLQVNRGGIQVDSGTTLNVTSLNIGSGNSVGGSLNLNGGSVNCSGSSAFGTFTSGSGSGSLNLNSGTLTVTNLSRGLTIFNINFNGGTLKAGADNPTFLTNASSAKVAAGNAIIDDGGYAINISAPLAADTTSGGLIKLGSGTLTLSGTNTYTAGTTVSNGTLVLAAGGGTGCIRNNLTIQSGAVVALTAGDALGFNGGGTSVTNVNIFGGMLTNAGAGLFESYSSYYNLSGGIVASAGGPFTFSGQGIASLSNSVLSVFSATVRFGTKSTLTLNAEVGTVPGGVDLSILGAIVQGGGISGSSVVKTGAGVVQLNATNTYNGSTLINAGKLALGATGAIPNTTNISIAAGATFDVSAVSPFALGSSQALVGSGTVNGSVTDSGSSQFYPGGINTIGTLTITTNLTLAGGDTLNFDFSAGGSNDIINVGGTVTPNGTTTINLTNWPVGGFLQTDYVLIQATSLGGSVGNFALANVPTGGRQTYTLVYDTVSSPQKVLLQVGGFNANLVWQGGSGNAWDVFTTQDWLNGGSPDYFFTSDNVLFSNVPPANTAVSIALPSVAPGSVTINSTNNYEFTGGYITGSAGLVKNGSGSAMLATANDYTGGTTINGGVLQLGDGAANNGSVVGSIVNNATLIVSNISAQTLNNTISGTGSIIAGGSATLNLSGNLSGAGQVIAVGTSVLTLSGTNSYSGGTIVSNGILTAVNTTSLGTPTSSVIATVQNSGALKLALAGTSSLTNQIVGSGSLIYSNSTPGSLNNGLVGLKITSSNNFSGGLIINVGSVYAYNNNALGTGPVTIDNGNLGGGAYYNQLFAGNGLNISNPITIVNASDSFDGVLMADPGPNNSYGTSDTNGATFSGPITIAVGATVQHGGVFCGPGNGTNWLVITGPVTNLNSGAGIGSRNGRTRFSGGGYYASFGVGGGTTQIGANNGVYTNAILQLSGGGSFDLNGYNQTFTGLSNTGGGLVNNSSTNVTSTLTLNISSDTTYATVIAGKLNLIKNGAALLNLTGTNTYKGNTTVNGGTLQFAQATFATNSTVTVASGAVLQLDFAVTNQVSSIVLGGVTQPPGVYDASTGAPFITGAGSLLVPSTVANYPTNITFTVTGGNTINLSWPASHLGWLVQSNSVNLAVSNDWHDIIGTGTATNYSVNLDPSQTNVFYRLRQP